MSPDRVRRDSVKSSMTFRFAQITDTHLYHPAGREPNNAPCPDPDRDRLYDQFLREVAAHEVAFIVHTGDLNSGNAGVERQQHLKRLNDRFTRDTGVPIYCTRGNHDSFIGARDIRTGDANFAHVYGPGTYAVHHNGWALLVVDRYYRAYQHTPDYYDMSPETLRRVDELLTDIPRDTPIVLCLHENPVGITRFHRGELLLHRLRAHNLQLLLFGHVQNNYISQYAGVPYATVVGAGRSFGSAPLTYNIVTCDDTGRAVCDFHPHTAHMPAPPPTPARPANGGVARPAGDWPHLLGPRGTREADEPLPKTAPKLAWSAQTPGSFSVGALNVMDGTLIAGVKSNGRFEQCQVRAHDAATGEVHWVMQPDADVEGGALLHDGLAYYGTTAGTMYCVGLEDGTPRWQWNNHENLPIASEPTLDGDTLHFGANWEMYGLDAATGETRWRNLVCARGTSYFGPGHAKPVIVGERVYHQRTYGGPQNPLLQSVDKHHGHALRTCAPEITNFPGQRQASPVYHDGRLVVAGNGLLVFDPDDIDRPRVHEGAAPASATPAIKDGSAYVSYHDAVRAHRLDDGTVRWETPHEGARFQFCGGVSALRVMRERRPPAGAFSAPLVSGDRLLVCDGAGHCRCLSTADGTELWRISVGSPILSAPTLSGNTLYIGAYDGTLYAFAW